MRMKGDIDLGFGVLHVAVLRARLRRRRRAIRALVLLMLLVIVVWALRPVFSGQGTLVLTNLPPDATSTLDGQPVTAPIIHALSGRHALRITRPGTYPFAVDLTITHAQTTTLTIPPLRPRPTVQPIPVPAPGATWQVASPDPVGGWRLTARAADVRPTPAAGKYRGPDTDEPPQMLLRLDALGVSRLSVLEAYTAADEQMAAEGRFWAAWEPLDSGFRGERGLLTITTPTATSAITTASAITGLWWAPAGRWLLIAERHGSGQDLTLWSATPPARSTTSVTVPGHVTSVQWSPDGRAAVVLSTTQPEQRSASHAGDASPDASPWDATLLLPPLGEAGARALRLGPPPAAPLGLVPLAWSADALYWTVDTSQDLALDHIPLAAGLPVRVGTLPTGTVALRVQDRDQIRLLVQDGSGSVTMRTWPAGDVLCTLDEVPATLRMGGVWRDDTLLLAESDQNLWQLTFVPEALR